MAEKKSKLTPLDELERDLRNGLSQGKEGLESLISEMEEHLQKAQDISEEKMRSIEKLISDLTNDVL
jgi:hypothetical protein